MKKWQWNDNQMANEKPNSESEEIMKMKWPMTMKIMAHLSSAINKPMAQLSSPRVASQLVASASQSMADQYHVMANQLSSQLNSQLSWHVAQLAQLSAISWHEIIMAYNSRKEIYSEKQPTNNASHGRYYMGGLGLISFWSMIAIYAQQQPANLNINPDLCM